METPIEAEKLIERIHTVKKALGEKLLILTHHYQRKEIIDLGDFRGDSFGLSKTAAESSEARFIVFCGVHFMAESAAILAQPQQIVQIPDREAGCWMADMAGIGEVERAWEEIASISGKGSLVPIVYMNSDAPLKAFCGRHGGAVCTSSNADIAVRWGFTVGEKILFFPDQHLGRNVGNQMGLKPDEMIVWDPKKPLGGNVPADIERARLILWDGYCLVHTRFEVEHILKMREKYPEAKIVVHPECTQEVVALSDACGSTSFIVNYVKNAPPGATIIIGTEINLIHRLALRYPDKKVLELHRSLCPNMFRINLTNLLRTLENLGQVNVVTVPEAIKADAMLALDRMLKLPSKSK
jgi:quinolinate synthase